jgi:hypothetical protein
MYDHEHNTLGRSIIHGLMGGGAGGVFTGVNG